MVAPDRCDGQRPDTHVLGEPAVEHAATRGSGRVERTGDDRPAAEPASQLPGADRPGPIEHPGTDDAVEPTDVCGHIAAGPTSGKHEPTCIWRPDSVRGGLY